MFKKYKNGIKLFHFDNLTNYTGISHFVTTREGGCSKPPYDALNLDLHVGDDPETVLNNRTMLSSLLGISIDNFITCSQVHSNKVKVITPETIDPMVSGNYNVIGAADAMITDIPRICIMILIADCVPILLYDPKKSVIGVVHAGWRGTVKQIARNAVEILIEKYSSSAEDILAGIGPSIGPCCYEVGTEVVTEVEKKLGDTESIILNRTPNGKAHLELWLANRRQLVQSGIPEENIETAGLCTYCHSELFFSYRYHGEKSGRFAAGILIH